MNANIQMTAGDPIPGRAPVAAPHPTHKFKLLLKREFWEHKGGFFWAPMVASAVFVVLLIFAIASAMILKHRVADEHVQIDGRQIMVGGLDLTQLTQHLGAEELRQLGGALDLFSMVGAGIPFMVLSFVVFFYALGSLYDDRRDRSVLFWKSLPISDTQTVMSKLVSATLMAPALAVLAGIVSVIASLLLLSVFVLFNGGNPLTLIWGPASPLSVIATFIAGIPVYALWALPTVGWLMLCSAWSRSKPFLWAVVTPLVLGVLISWFDVMQLFDLDTSWYWQNIGLRALGSTFPGTWLNVADLAPLQVNEPGDISQLANLQSMYSLLATPQLWIGAIAGIAMVIGAIRLRRWRDEG